MFFVIFISEKSVHRSKTIRPSLAPSHAPLQPSEAGLPVF